MKNPNFVLLYVKNPAASAAFYSGLLGRPAIESSENFVMLSFAGDIMLGLWATHDAVPKATQTGGGAEIGIPAESKEAVDALHKDWVGRGYPIAQKPTQMDFGYTFVALDPDAHRVRVYFPAA